jgi:hypothetical protein
MWSVLALGVGIGLLSTMLGGVFVVRRVDVVGSGLPTAAIVRASGALGQNIFTLRSDGVVARAGRVREVVIERVETSFPDRVTIYARSRIPMVAWRTAHGLFLLDPDGRIIRGVARTTLPIISGAGNGRSLGPGVVQAVRYAVQALPRAPSGAVAAFQFAPGTGLTVVSRAGWTADIGTGSGQTLVDRIVTLVTFLEKIGSRAAQLKLVDLRYRAPYARFTGP